MIEACSSYGKSRTYSLQQNDSAFNRLIFRPDAVRLHRQYFGIACFAFLGRHDTPPAQFTRLLIRTLSKFGATILHRFFTVSYDPAKASFMDYLNNFATKLLNVTTYRIFQPIHTNLVIHEVLLVS
jgi:hypothetical protein